MSTTRGPLAGRTVLVTGGASGIGAACARLIAARGARVVVLDLRQEAAAVVADEIGGIAVACDVTDRAALGDLSARLAKEGHVVDGLVASAGIVQAPERPQDLTTETFRRVVGIDLEGVFNACVEFGAPMMRAGFGSIVTIGSVAGMRSMPLHAYSPAKAGVINLTQCLAAEWGRAGVRVNCVSPGFTMTPALREQVARGLRDPALLAGNSALGRMVEPEQVAAGVAFLLSDDAAAITGVNLPVDCGWLVTGSWATYGGLRDSGANQGLA